MEDSTDLITVSIVMNEDVRNSSRSVTLNHLLIPNHVQFYIDLYILGVFSNIIAIFGIITNIVCLVVFWAQGIGDCVTVCLFSLAISDLGICFFTLINGLCDILVKVYPDFVLRADHLQVVLQSYRGMFYDISMLSTVFISVERCLCVVLPFKFKTLVTLKSAIIILASIYVMSACMYLPVFLSASLTWRWDPKLNRSRIMIQYSDFREPTQLYINMLSQTVLGFSSVAIVLISTIIMVLGLQHSAKFREAKANTAAATTASSTPSTITNANAPESQNKDTDQTKSKNRRLIKMVSILATMFVVCHMPRICSRIASRIEPRLLPRAKGMFKNTFRTMLVAIRVMSLFNASLNIVVYYRLKPNFKEKMLSIFLYSSKTKKTKSLT